MSIVKRYTWGAAPPIMIRPGWRPPMKRVAKLPLPVGVTRLEAMRRGDSPLPSRYRWAVHGMLANAWLMVRPWYVGPLNAGINRFHNTETPEALAVNRINGKSGVPANTEVVATGTAVKVRVSPALSVKLMAGWVATPNHMTGGPEVFTWAGPKESATERVDSAKGLAWPTTYSVTGTA